MNMEKRFRIGITQALSAAVGYEMILNAFSNAEILEFFTPVIYGNERLLQASRKASGVNMPYKVVAKAENAHDGHVNLINLPIADGAATQLEVEDYMAFTSLSAACTDVNEAHIDALVVFPADVVENLVDVNSRISVVEYLARNLQHSVDVLPMLCAPMLRIALPNLNGVKQNGSVVNLEQELKQCYTVVCRDFLASAPRVALLADTSTSAEGETATPECELITRLSTDANLRVFGPYPYARYFNEVQYKHFECALAADSAIAQRLFAEATDREGVLFLSGFDVPICCPLMPTEGCDEISVHALLQSLYQVLDIYRNRMAYDEAHANPLPHVVQHDRREERRNRAEAK